MAADSIPCGSRGVLVLALGFAFFAAGLRAQNENVKPPISQTPFTAEQLAVYRTVLVDWFQNEKFSINLAELTTASTSPVESEPDDDAVCAKGLALEPRTVEVHRFQEQDLALLGGHIRLVDPDSHAKQVREHDPGNAIRNGTSVDDAVKNGFAHGLFTLGEIRFDKSHAHAVVSFSFWCGRLCGHGSTILFEKKDGAWKQKKQCGGWIS
jgi:hypothetical protein